MRWPLWTAFLAMGVVASVPAAAQTVTVLASFNGTNGEEPSAGLTPDAAGNLFGTSYIGGAFNDGTVFELTPPAPGQAAWTETVLANFNGKNGQNPTGSLIADAAGTLYGTTKYGGASKDGTVFKLKPPESGKSGWTETVLARFNGANGALPCGSLIADQAGNLYGTTEFGGTFDDGTVFKLTPPAAGATGWKQTILMSFDGTDGKEPLGGLIADAAGNLYGTTSGDVYLGGSNDGNVFELSPPTTGQTAWTASILSSFSGTNGAAPFGSLLAGNAGELYGTTALGGGCKSGDGCGTVFRLSPPKAGQSGWTQKILTSFGKKGRNGLAPVASLIADASGNLYGTTEEGGANFGTVFELARPTPGNSVWTESVLASFNVTNGALPKGDLLLDKAGNLYGTTNAGGASNDGTVFEVTP